MAVLTNHYEMTFLPSPLAFPIFLFLSLLAKIRVTFSVLVFKMFLEQRLKERSSNNRPNLGSISWVGNKLLTLLLMPCCACRQEPSMAVLWEALPAADWDRCRYLQKPLHWGWGPHRRVEERIVGPKGDGNPIGKPKMSTNLDPWELWETKPPT